MIAAPSIRSPVEPRVTKLGQVFCPCGGRMGEEEFSGVVRSASGRPVTQGGPKLLWYRCERDAAHITGARPA